MSEAVEILIPRAGPAGVLSRRTRTLPPPGEGEVQVAIEAAGVAYADIVMRSGAYAGVKPPVVPGYDFVGRIEAMGPGVADFSVGQRVAGVTVTGSYATRRNVDAAWLTPAPEGADAARLVAAALNGLTAWQMLHGLARPDRGEWILVHGAAGGVGGLLLDLARLAGVKAIGSASRGKHALVAEQGGVPVDYAAEDVAARARAISDGGVVAAFDHVGGRHLRTVSLKALAPGGLAILYGGYDATRGGRVRPLAALDLMFNSRVPAYGLFQRSQGVIGYSAPLWRAHRAARYRRDLSAVIGLAGEGRLAPRVGATFPLSQAVEAHRALESRTIAGKIVLLPSSAD